MMFPAQIGITEEALRMAVSCADGVLGALGLDTVQKDLQEDPVKFGMDHVIGFDLDYTLLNLDEFHRMRGFDPGYETLKNGIPVRWLGVFGNFELPLAICLYCGSDKYMHAFVPHSGNVLNYMKMRAYRSSDDPFEDESTVYSRSMFDMDRLRHAFMRNVPKRQ